MAQVEGPSAGADNSRPQFQAGDGSQSLYLNAMGGGSYYGAPMAGGPVSALSGFPTFTGIDGGSSTATAQPGSPLFSPFADKGSKEAVVGGAGMLLAFNDAPLSGTSTLEGKPGTISNTSSSRESWTPPSSDAISDPVAATISERHDSTITEAQGATSAEKQANANLKIDANGNVSVDADKLAKDNYQCKVWIDENYKGTADEIKGKLEQAKTELASKGINLQIPETLPAFITNRSVVNPTPEPNPDIKPNPDDKPAPDDDSNNEDGNSCPDGNCGPKPGPGPGPTPPDDNSDPKPDGDSTPQPDGNIPKPDGLSTTPDWIKKTMSDPLASASKDGIHPNTFKNFGDTLLSSKYNHMPMRLASKIRSAQARDLDGDGKISPEEEAAATKELEDYLATDEGKADLAEFKQNAGALANRLENGPMKDKTGAEAINKFAESLDKPSENRALISNFATVLNKGDAGTLTTGDVLGQTTYIPEALQKAVVNLSIADVAAKPCTNTTGQQEAHLLDLSAPPTEDRKDAYMERISRIRETLVKEAHTFGL